MKTPLLLLILFASTVTFSQKTYEDSIKSYLQNYVQNHEVVKGRNREHIKFYEVDKSYRVTADFKPSASSAWLTFKTSGNKTQVYRVYGTLSFKLNGKPLQLKLYQSQDLLTDPQYKNYLFLPFTDSTSGNETYASGRYIDLTTADIKNNKVLLDFNKAYNPYCAYVSGVYNCPVPPRENALTVAIKAGEKNFSSSH
ncbi:MAG TPA: DUF1684 domain-containing protein [Flavisolibacter sp.]|nr:DUF1684 domain-containing protein [Flavisolibacter sp.]